MYVRRGRLAKFGPDAQHKTRFMDIADARGHDACVDDYVLQLKAEVITQSLVHLSALHTYLYLLHSYIGY